MLLTENKNQLLYQVFNLLKSFQSQMEMYINMNESFGDKNSASTAKSFFNSYEECIQTLKQQLQNHKKALLTAEELLDQYKQENEKLIFEVETLKYKNIISQQKYAALQSLLIKLSKLQQKQIIKQTKKSHCGQNQVYQNFNHERCILALNKRITFLEIEFDKFQQKQKKYRNSFSNKKRKFCPYDLILINKSQASNVFSDKDRIRSNSQFDSWRQSQKVMNQQSKQVLRPNYLSRIAMQATKSREHQKQEQQKRGQLDESRLNLEANHINADTLLQYPQRRESGKNKSKPTKAKNDLEKKFQSEKFQASKFIPKPKKMQLYQAKYWESMQIS